MYPDDPRPGRAKRSGREQVLALLIAIGVAIVVTLFGGVFLYVARMMLSGQAISHAPSVAASRKQCVPRGIPRGTQVNTLLVLR